MENVTLDQAELVFSLFVAQNADRKISEFVEKCDSDAKNIRTDNKKDE